jgi:hypothetical protein
MDRGSVARAVQHFVHNVLAQSTVA